ncbi:MAG: hypothetical protein AB8B50_16775 [Pirellulaceae bacterium]
MDVLNVSEQMMIEGARPQPEPQICDLTAFRSAMARMLGNALEALETGDLDSPEAVGRLAGLLCDVAVQCCDRSDAAEAYTWNHLDFDLAGLEARLCENR